MEYIFAYILLFIGVAIEGEFIFISTLIAAIHGFLDPWIVICIGITATYLTDIAYYFIGKRGGEGYFKDKPKLYKAFIMVNEKIENHPYKTFISYRFLYGLRSIAPMAIGASGISVSSFLFYSAIGTGIWASVCIALSYIFGDWIVSHLDHIKHVERYFIIGFGVIGLGIGLYRYTTRNRKINVRT